jgi:SagB-type dehydrogenase family enzyme
VRNDERLGTLAEEYHVACRNQAAFKHIAKAYQIHFEPHIQQLVSEAPLHLSGCTRVSLPSQRAPLNVSLEDAITRRVSGRRFSAAPLLPEQLATLLYLGNGIRRVDEQHGLRSYQRNVPNSGNLGSVEMYPIVLNVQGIEPGIYHFDSVHHDLACLQAGQFSTWLNECVFYQIEFSEAAVALVLTAAIGRLAAKYGLGAYRLAHLDVGHVSENLYLASTGLGLEVCATAGFINDELDAALQLDGLDNAALLVVLIGFR